MTDFGSCVGVWGAYWGILTQCSCSPRIISGCCPDAEKWYTKLFRVLIGVCCALPGLILAIILMEVNVDNAYVSMIFATMIPVMYIGFAFFFLADLVN